MNREIIKIANKLQTKIAQQALYDIKHISDIAKDLARHMDILEQAAGEGDDPYAAVDNPQEAQRRMFRVRRLLNTIRSVGSQMYKDASTTGMSAQTAEEYVGHLKRLLAWLRQVEGMNKYNAFFQPLENAIDTFEPKPIRGRTEPGSAYTVAPMTITAPPKPPQKPKTRIPEAPTFEELTEPTVIEYGPGMRAPY